MSLKTGWESIYFLSYQLGLISADDGATDGVYVTTDKGITGVAGECGMMLDSPVFISPGQEHIKTPKTTGLAEDSVIAGAQKEYIQGRRTPTVSLAMGLDKMTLGTFGWLLFQQGVTQAATPFAKTMVVPVAGQSAPEVFAAVGHQTGDGTEANGYSLTGCIATQLAIAGAEGERMTLTADMTGRSYVDTYDHSLSDNTVQAISENMFWNYTFTLAGSSVNLTSFDISIANNAAIKHYSSLIPSAYILQKYTSSGNMKMVMTDATIGDNAQIDNFLSGTDALLVGTYTDNIVMSINMKYTGVEMDAADENMLNLPYEAVTDGTNSSVKFVVSDGVDRGIT